MIRPLKIGTTIILAAISFVAPAAAQQKSSEQRPAADPNERVCEDVVLVGSRLAKKRICATRQEWADQKRLDRQEVERAQTQLCVVDPVTKKC